MMLDTKTKRRCLVWFPKGGNTEGVQKIENENSFLEYQGLREII